MKPYASGTIVSVDKSKAELDTLLSKHGATSRGVMSNDLEGNAIVVFQIEGRHYRLEIPLPRYDKFRTKKDPRAAWKTLTLTTDQQRIAYEQACRERWRAVVLLCKAKLELVALGVSTVEREFLADLVLPGGDRLHARFQTAIENAYTSGKFQLPAHTPAPSGSPEVLDAEVLDG